MSSRRTWVFESTVAGGMWKNISWGLTAFNNKIADHGFIYENKGHGFVDPLTGIFLWVGVLASSVSGCSGGVGIPASSSRSVASSCSGSRSPS